MRKFVITYRPDVHEGHRNLQGDLHAYVVEVEEQFANSEEKDNCAGITAKCVESGMWKRFRWDRITNMAAA